MTAALCELQATPRPGLCGVLASGRCPLCGRAYCASHQARLDPYGDVDVRCWECRERQGREVQASIEARLSAEQELSRRAATEFEPSIEAFVAAAVAAGFPGATAGELTQYATREEGRWWWRRTVNVSTVTPIRYWALGQFVNQNYGTDLEPTTWDVAISDHGLVMKNNARGAPDWWLFRRHEVGDAFVLKGLMGLARTHGLAWGGWEVAEVL